MSAKPVALPNQVVAILERPESVHLAEASEAMQERLRTVVGPLVADAHRLLDEISGRHAEAMALFRETTGSTRVLLDLAAITDPERRPVIERLLRDIEVRGPVEGDAASS
jgi:hypothetical protein